MSKTAILSWTTRSRRHVLASFALAATATTCFGLIGCDPSAPPNSQSLATRRTFSSRKNADILLSGIADTLNDLANRVDLELNPAQPILTALTSSDGNEVLATCTVNPRTPDGPFNYLQVPLRNVDFQQLGIRPGDLLRYYVKIDLEAAEQGFEETKPIELRVRRLDAANPRTALIVEGGLNGPMTDPRRIEIWRYRDDRMDAINSMLERYLVYRLPPVGWEPSPDEGELQRLVERCNQWLRNQSTQETEWRVDPLLATLPDELTNNARVAQEISAQRLSEGRFGDEEGRLMQQAVWCRDISQWARGSAVADVEIATALFDWTVRNIELVEPDAAAMVFHPWQALIYGRGTAEHRAWVFVELCRQMQIDAVLLATRGGPDQPAEFWLPAAHIEGELFLFDARLGLPLPSADDGAVATLREIQNDPELLNSLDAADLDYGVSAERTKRLEAWIVSSAEQLSRRHAMLQAALQGEKYVVLAADNARLAERLAQHEGVDAIALWSKPFQWLAEQYELKPSGRRVAVEAFEPFAVRPRLWKARVLHFLGRREVWAEDRNDPLAAPQLGHKEASLLYTHPRVRPHEDILAELPVEKRAVYDASKAAASYWLGLLSYDRGNYAVSSRWLDDAVPRADKRDTWDDGARYNLARAHEALGELAPAVQILESDPADSPQRHGNLLRAQRLRDKLAAEDSDGDQAEAEPPDAKPLGAEQAGRQSSDHVDEPPDS